jgi:hypothetical protein
VRCGARRRVPVVAVLLSVLGSVLLLGSPRPAYADAPTGDSAQRLADRYRPVVMLRQYPELCSDTGEPFVPMPVDPILGNPEVALRQVGNGDAVITWGPTAKDLYGRGTGTYLDLAGDGLSPGCIYATDSARYTPLDRSVVYAHVATQSDRPGYLALQYWLYWYYNDWNDKHESDWEFIQVLFKADTVQQALGQDPFQVGYAQHTGGETATWTDPKLRKEGTHPVVYSSERSHASYFAPALFLGRASSEGFGCDNTQGPSTRVTPRAVLLPDSPSGPNDPLAWMAFQGRWGERQSGPNNGPDGPTAKPRWSAPVTWQEGLRPSSFEIPGGSAAPPPVVGTFCTVVGKGSALYIELAANPARVLTVAALLLLLLAILLRSTSWSAVPALPIVQRRRAGQIVRASARAYRRHPLAFVTTGVLAVPVGVVSAAVTALIVHLPYLGDAVEVSTDQGPDVGSRALVGSAVGAALWPVTVLLVSAAVVHIMASGGPSAAGWTLGAAVDAIREVGRRLKDLASAFVPAAIAIIVLGLVVIGLPVATWLFVRFQFVGQVVMVEGTRGESARRRSSMLVRHRWWHTAMFALIIWSGVHVVGVTVGLVLLVVFTGLPLWSVSLVVLVAQIALTPLGAIALTLLYGDACAEHAELANVASEPSVVL